MKSLYDPLLGRARITDPIDDQKSAIRKAVEEYLASTSVSYGGGAGGSSSSGVVKTVVAGTNVTVDSTDPANPIVSSLGGADLDTSGALELARKSPEAKDSYPLRGWRIALARRATAPAVVTVIGDSLTAGYECTDFEQTAWPAVYENQLSRQYNTRQKTAGFVVPEVPAFSIYPQGLKWDTIQGSTINRGLSGYARSLSGSQYCQIARTTDGFIVFYTAQKTGGASLKVYIDGVLTDTFSTTDAAVSATPGYDSGRSKSYSLTYGSHTLKVQTSGAGTSILDACYVASSNRTTGVRVDRCGHPSWGMTDYLDSSNPSSLQHIKNTLPNLIVVACGVADAASTIHGLTVSEYKELIQNMITALRTASPLSSIVFVHEPQVDIAPTNWTTGYLDGLRDIAETDGDILVLEWQSAVGTYGTASDPYSIAPFDDLHPDDAGHSAFAQIVFDGTASLADGILRPGKVTGTLSADKITASDDRIVLEDQVGDGATVKIYKDKTETEAIFGFGYSSILGNGIFAVGPGGSTPADTYLMRSGAGEFTLAGGKMNSSAAPTGPDDFTNKAYVDSVALPSKWERNTYSSIPFLQPVANTDGLVIGQDLHSSVGSSFSIAAAVFNGHIDGVSDGTNYFLNMAYGTSYTAFGGVYTSGHANGTASSPTQTTSGSYLGGHSFTGYDGTSAWISNATNHYVPGLWGVATSNATTVMEQKVYLGGVFTPMLSFDTLDNSIKFNEAQLDSDITFYNDLGTSLTLDGSTGAALFTNQTTNSVPLTIKTKASQTANALEIRDSTSTQKLRFTRGGDMTIGDNTGTALADLEINYSSTSASSDQYPAFAANNSATYSGGTTVNAQFAAKAGGIDARFIANNNSTYRGVIFATLPNANSWPIVFKSGGIESMYLDPHPTRGTKVTFNGASGQTTNMLDLIDYGGTQLATFNKNGYLRIGTGSPGANIHIQAGTATAGTAPLKFDSGTNLTTPVAGVMEYDGGLLFTPSDATRRNVVLATSATKTTAGAPYTNDGYITVNIGGTDVKIMTTA